MSDTWLGIYVIITVRYAVVTPVQALISDNKFRMHYSVSVSLERRIQLDKIDFSQWDRHMTPWVISKWLHQKIIMLRSFAWEGEAWVSGRNTRGQNYDQNLHRGFMQEMEGYWERWGWGSLATWRVYKGYAISSSDTQESWVIRDMKKCGKCQNWHATRGKQSGQLRSNRHRKSDLTPWHN